MFKILDYNDYQIVYQEDDRMLMGFGDDVKSFVILKDGEVVLDVSGVMTLTRIKTFVDLMLDYDYSYKKGYDEGYAIALSEKRDDVVNDLVTADDDLVADLNKMMETQNEW